MILVAFLSVYSILFNNYFNGNLLDGLDENFENDYKVKHYEEQLFTGYDIAEFHLATCEKRELLGSSSHLLYICKKAN